MPAHIEGEFGVTLMFGNGLTVTVTVAVATQPAADVPVTVYVAVAVGDAVTDDPVVTFSPVAGDQV